MLTEAWGKPTDYHTWFDRKQRWRAGWDDATDRHAVEPIVLVDRDVTPVGQNVRGVVRRFDDVLETETHRS